MKVKYLLIIILLIFNTSYINAQISKSPTFNTNNGIGIVAPDSLFSLNFRFRTQLRAGYSTISTKNLAASEIEARIRRMRLRFEGFVFSPKINYYVQLSFSRGDLDWVSNETSDINTSPNIIRDVVLTYYVKPNLAIIFGQTKLPGNRQRVVSSAELQFVDRSLVNSTFNIDRDFGIQTEYKNKIASVNYILKGAISTGEGRNVSKSQAGLAYTGRIEILPLGTFANNGDYFEGDLEREKKPKLSIAAGYHYNKNASRTAGTIGDDLYQNINLGSFLSDMLFKYNGFSFTAEYLTRNTNMPITRNAKNLERTVYVGSGLSLQSSYIFKNNLEIATRYGIVSPSASIKSKELQREELGVSLTKYLRKHRLKIQGQVFYNAASNLSINAAKKGSWNPIFQIELGI